ncbi:GNAT family N-acetyltransferase [Galbibacter sp. EGI 63066]|uniref:GNAT family N-acetyltransferase n=1 Tax=Galbibacter sp. EGI 63066 TaxID=2993559 RepID=UPI002248E222|nr:GNAT family N-acetyltransferase [Galbibacter sp. EGI 63066]MCX2679781.1 GNAT family N-acetyltransferase [Galbibacter sp. EGI 63066]
MNIIQSEHLTEKQKKNIIELWNEEYPEALSLSDVNAFDIYLEGLSDKHHLLVINEKTDVVGWLIDFIRDNERCFAMLLHTSLQGKGYGTKLLNLAKQTNSELNGWVIDNDEQQKQNGQNYKSPTGFYKKNDFEIVPGIQSKKNDINGIKVRWQKPKNNE